MTVLRRILICLIIGVVCGLSLGGGIIELDVPLVDTPHDPESTLSKTELAERRERQGRVNRLHVRMLRRFKQKRYDKARDLAARIVRLIPSDGTALYNLACAHARLSETDEAIETLRRAVDRGFVEMRHMEHDPDLASLRGLDAFAQILAQRDTIQRERAERIRRELRRRFGAGYLITIDHDNRLVFATDTDRETLNGLRDDLTERAAALRRQLFVHPPEQYVTIIIPQPGTIKLGRIGGVFRRTDATIVARRVGMTCRHEFTHALHFADMEARAQRHPIWILEGFATLFETADLDGDRLRPTANDRLNALKFFLARDRLKPLATLLEIEQTGFMKAPAVCYAMSRYLLMYLHAEGKLQDWYRTYTAGYDDDSTGRLALETVLGKDLGVIEADWHEWIRRLPRPATRVHTNQPYMGVAISPVTEGLQIERVVPGSGAEKAGLRGGDLIVRVAGRQLADGTELIRFVTSREVGDAVQIRYRRSGRYATVRVKLQAKPSRLPRRKVVEPDVVPSDERGALPTAPRRRPPLPNPSLPPRRAA